MAELTDRKTRKLIKRGRGRPWKNFLWWLFGMVSSLLISAGAAALVICVIPIRTFTGDNTEKWVNDEIGSGTILNFLMNYKSYSIGDLPILEEIVTQILTNTPIGEYVTIDYDGLEELDYDTIASGEVDWLKYINITASLESLGVTQYLGDLANLSAVTDWERVLDEIDTTAENFNPGLYYYEVSEDKKPNVKVGDKYYARVYDDDGRLNEGASQPYYYPALQNLPILDMVNVIGDRIGYSSAESLLGIFGINDGIILKLVEGKSIMGLSTLNTSNIKLSLFLDPPDVNPDNKMLYDILCGATGVSDPNAIVIDDLNSLNIDQISIVSLLEGEEGMDDALKIIRAACGVEGDGDVLIGTLKNDFDINKVGLDVVIDEDNPDNKQLYDILRSITGKDAKDEDGNYISEVTIGDLSNGGLSFDNLSLGVVIDEEDEKNEQLFEILRSITGKSDDEPVTVGDLSSGELSFDNLELNVVIDEDNPDNKQLYDILRSVTGKTEKDESGNYTSSITIGDLSSGELSFDNLDLAIVIDEEDEDNEQLFKILRSISGKADDEPVTVGDLNGGVDINKLDLAVVIDEDDPDNKQLYDILRSVTGTDAKDEDGNYTEKITLGDLSGDSLNFDNLDLSVVIDEDNPDNDQLYNILRSVTGKDAKDEDGKYIEKITLGDLNGNLNFDNLELTAIIEDNEENEQLLDLLHSITGKDAKDENGKYIEKITVADLKGGVSFEKVKLKEFIDPYEVDENGDYIYEMEDDGVTPKKDENGNPIKVITDLYNILTSACRHKEYKFEEDGVTPIYQYEEDGVTPKLDEDGNPIQDYDLVKPTEDTITVGDLETMDIKVVDLADVIDEETNPDIFEILRAVYYPDDSDHIITIGDLDGEMNFDSVKLSLFLDPYEKDENGDYIYLFEDDGVTPIYEMEEDGVTPKLDENGDPIQARELTEIFSVLTEACTKKVYKFEDDGVTPIYQYEEDGVTPKLDENGDPIQDYDEIVPSADALTVGEINDMQIDKVPLKIFIDPNDPANDDLYNILVEAAGEGVTKETIRVEDLKGDRLDFDRIDLGHFIDDEENDTLYEILRSAAGLGEDDPVHLGDLNNFDFNNVKLKTVVDPYEKDEDGNYVYEMEDDGVTPKLDGEGQPIKKLSDLYKVLNDACQHKEYLVDGNGDPIYQYEEDGVTPKLDENGDPIQDYAMVAANEDNLTVGDLAEGGLDIQQVKIGSLLTNIDDDLETILVDGCGMEDDGNGNMVPRDPKPEFDDLRVCDLSTFSIDYVHLNAILDDQEALSLISSCCGMLEKLTPEERAEYDLLSGEEQKTFLSDRIIIKDLGDYDINQAKISDVLDLELTVAEIEAAYSNPDSYLYNEEYANDPVKAHEAALKEHDSRQQLMTILLQGCGTEEHNTYDKLTVGDINSLDISQVSLDVMLDEEENKDLFDILRSATGKTSTDPVTVDDLNRFDANEILLSSVLPYEDENGNPTNQDMYDILIDACPRPIYDPENPETIIGFEPVEKDELKIDDLNNFNLNRVRMTTILDENQNANLFNILRSATDESTNGAITVSSLNNFDAGRIYMVDVLGYTGNETLYSILASSTATYDHLSDDEKAEYDALPDDEKAEYLAGKVKVGDLDRFNASDISLTDVLPYDDDNSDGSETSTLYSILASSTATYDHLSDAEKAMYDALPADEKAEYLAGKVKVGDLDRFSANDIKMTDVLPYAGNENIYSILVSATPATSAETMTVGSLNSFTAGNIKMVDVLGYTGNETLYSILASSTSTYDYLSDDEKAEYNVLADDAKAEYLAGKVTVGDLDRFNADDISMTDVLPYAGNENIYSILVSATPATSAETMTVGSLNSFTAGNIKMVDVLPYDADGSDGRETATLYSILASSTGTYAHLSDAEKEAYNGLATETDKKIYLANKITVGDLDRFNANDIKMTDVLPYTGNEKIYSILVSATPATSAETMTVGSLNTFTPGDIKMVDVLDYAGNETLYSILASSTSTYDHLSSEEKETYNGLGSEAAKDAYLANRIKVGHLDSFDATKIKMTDVLPYSGNESIYSILISATPATSAETMTVGDLNSFTAGDILLNDVLPYEDENGNPQNTEIYNILLSACAEARPIYGNPGNPEEITGYEPITKDTLKISDLNAFKPSNIKMTDVLPNDDGNKTLYSILISATPATSAETMTIGDLNTFTPSDIKLVDVLPYDTDDSDGSETATLYRIIAEATKTYEGLTDEQKAAYNGLSTDAEKDEYLAKRVNVGDLENFDISEVKLGTVMESSDNAILEALISDPEVTIGNLGTKINSIDLFKAYGDTGFTKDSAKAAQISGAYDVYRKGTDGEGKVTYTYQSGLGMSDVTADNNLYFVSNESTVWLLFCFDASDIEAMGAYAGRVRVYTQSSMTFNDLVNGSATDPIMNATIYTLIAAGMITEPDGGYNPLVRSKSIQQIIDSFNV